MKKNLMKFIIYGTFLFSVASTSAQWTGTNPVYHTGRVLIGDSYLYEPTTAPQEMIQLTGTPALFRMIYNYNNLQFTDIINEDGNLVFKYKEEFDTSWHETFRIGSNGNITIGNGEGIFKLNVNGRMKLGGADAGMWIESGATDWFVGRDESYLRFQYDGVDRFKINPNGNALLQGKFECKEIKVSSSPTADFVFEKDYNLRSLDEVEKFITTNKHLPEIASAEEMECNGVNIAEFQIKLLQKIEELTLYVIDLKKENTRLSKEISVLSSKK